MPKHKDSCEPREVVEPLAVEADSEEEAVEKSVKTTDSRRNQTSSEKSDRQLLKLVSRSAWYCL